MLCIILRLFVFLVGVVSGMTSEIVYRGWRAMTLSLYIHFPSLTEQALCVNFYTIEIKPPVLGTKDGKVVIPMVGMVNNGLILNS